MIEAIVGNEPYLIYQYKKQIKEDKDGVTVVGEIPKDVTDFFFGGSLLFETKCMICEEATQNGVVESNLYHACEYATATESANTLYLFFAVEPKKKELEVMEKKGIVIRQFNKLTMEQLKKTIPYWCKEEGARIKNDAFFELLHRTDYLDNPEVSLFHLRHEVEKLCLAGNEISADMVKRVVTEMEPAKVFQFVDNLIRLQPEKIGWIFDQVERMMQEKDFNALRTMGLIERNIRIAIKKEILLEKITNDDTMKNMIGVVYLPAPMAKKEAIFSLKCLAESREQIKTGLLKPKMAFRRCIEKMVLRKELMVD